MNIFNRPLILSRHLLLSFTAICILSAGLLSASAGAWAQEAATTHKVVSGDTLYELSKKYLDDASRWTEFQNYNEIKNPKRLVPGSELIIPPAATPSATVIFTRGNVTLMAPDTMPGEVIQVGDVLPEGSRIMVGQNSYLSLQLADGSIVRTLANSVLRLTKVREIGENNVKNLRKVSRILELESGDLDISVTPQPADPLRKAKPKPNSFEIITPMAVAAVRGTRFDVSVEGKDTASGVTQGIVDIRQNKQSRSAKHTLLSAGTGIAVKADGKLGKVRPLLTAPDLSAIPDLFNESGRVSLAWSALPGAALYQVRIATDAEMQNVVRNVESVVPHIKFTGLTDGEYVLGIRAVDTDGIIGYQASHGFRVNSQPAFPLYLGPARHQLVESMVKLECTQVPGASAYHLQVSRDIDFASTVLDADSLETCSYDLNGLEEGVYFWRVAARIQSLDGGMQQGPYSQPSQFEVNIGQAGSAPDTVSTAYWIEESDVVFTAQISSDETFSKIIEEKELALPSIALDSLPPGIYYIRLQAKDTDGFASEFSSPRRIEIKAVDNSTERTWADKPK
jgi:hypothetical protein